MWESKPTSRERVATEPIAWMTTVSGAIVVLNGAAIIDRTASPPDQHEAFITKYQDFLDRYGWTPAWFADNYPTRIGLTIRSIRGS